MARVAELDPAALRRRRAGAQGLGDARARDPVGAVRRLLAVQAQDLRAARLAVRARTEGVTAAAVDRALGEDGALVVDWLARGTLHLVAAEDHGWLHSLTAPGREAVHRRRLAQEGVPWDDAERAVGIVGRALADAGPLTRAQLAERLAASGIRTAGQATPHLLGLAAQRGIAVLGPVAPGGGQAFVLARDWLPDAAPPERGVALAELARRYLAGHGPAAAEDLAHWSGLPLRDARAGLGAIAGELEDAGGLAALRGAPPSSARVPARLLPAFDPYLLGWRDRTFAVPAAHARRVHPGGGILRAVASVDAEAVGTWSLRRRGTAVAVEVEPFGPLAAVDAAALDAEAADVARFEGTERADVPGATAGRRPSS
jgi:winged helix DNA-binding protein